MKIFTVGAILLAGLTESYRPLIMGIEASQKEITSDTIIAKLLDTQPDSSSDASGFFSKKQGKGGKFKKGGKDDDRQ